MKILSSFEIAEIEKKTIETLGIPEVILMENAALSLCEEIEKRTDKSSKIAFLCGFGNNAGDGFAAARQLICKGFTVTIFHPKDINKFSPAAKANFDILKNMKVSLYPIEKDTNLENFDVIIDALFGTGLKRPIKDKDDFYVLTLIEKANESKALKISIDIPSGLFADSAQVLGVVFKTDLTVTFTALKICLALHPAKELCDEVIVKNISIPENYADKYSREFLTIENLPKLKIRRKDSHKGDYGSAFILGGSADMAGAPSMASAAAMKIGSGLTFIGLNEETGLQFISGYPEIILKRWSLNEPASIINFINSKITSLLIGCGMGTDKNTAEFIKEVVFQSQKPIIIDADGINCLNISDLKKIKAPFAITPHIKEFARLLDVKTDDIKADSLNLAKNFALSNKCLLTLKSADTIIACPDGRVFVADFGTPALAKGGSGDGLAGTFAGLLAQGYSFEDAAKLAVFINGQASKYALEKNHVMTVTASIVIENFWRALNDIPV